MNEKINLEEITKLRKDTKEKMGVEIPMFEGEEEAQIEAYEGFKLKKSELLKKLDEAVGQESIALLTKELKDLVVEFYGEHKEGISDKAFLLEIKKNGNYYEFKSFLDGLPEKLPIPENPKEAKNVGVMTEKEMTEGHKFFTKEEAFGLAAKHSKEGKDGLIWFEDGDVLCKVSVYGGGSSVYVYSFSAGHAWDVGNVSFFRN